MKNLTTAVQELSMDVGFLFGVWYTLSWSAEARPNN